MGDEAQDFIKELFGAAPRAREKTAMAAVRRPEGKECHACGMLLSWQGVFTQAADSLDTEGELKVRGRGKLQGV